MGGGAGGCPSCCAGAGAGGACILTRWMPLAADNLEPNMKPVHAQMTSRQRGPAVRRTKANVDPAFGESAWNRPCLRRDDTRGTVCHNHAFQAANVAFEGQRSRKLVCGTRVTRCCRGSTLLLLVMLAKDVHGYMFNIHAAHMCYLSQHIAPSLRTLATSLRQKLPTTSCHP